MTSTTSASTDPPNNNNNGSNNSTNNNNSNNNSNNNNNTNNNNKNSNNTKTTPRKKKAARACIHCQKAHLTCDDARPCQRCIKRGLNSTCTDGARKKAKYLQDTDESSIQPRYIPPQSNTPPSNGLQQQTNPLLASFAANTNPLDAFGAGLDTNQLLDLNNYNYGFGSTATNLEYSILSSMLGSPINQLLDSSSATTPTTPTSLSNLWQAAAAAANLTSSSTNNNSNNNSNNSTPTTSSFNNPLDTTTAHHIGPFSTSTPSATTTGLDTVLYSPDQNSIGSPYSGNTPTSQTTANNVRMSSLSSYGEGAVVAKVVSPNTALAQVKRRNQLVTPEMVYSRATKPYSYADGYHYLINYVRQKMSREDLMRISRALALFRPSVLASMLNLNEVDLIYTEKCLQRTLLEYEKLISYSGTPTVVWRRTGEIVLVGKEFSLLTQWSRDALLGKKTYIYELMSNSSTIEYWERYSSCAFDNSDSAVYSSCILLSPTKRSVPCTFCFTIKRDIFDLPSVIIGNFLPILS